MIIQYLAALRCSGSQVRMREKLGDNGKMILYEQKLQRNPENGTLHRTIPVEWQHPSPRIPKINTSCSKHAILEGHETHHVIIPSPEFDSMKW
jgi:hypothetical protein